MGPKSTNRIELALECPRVSVLEFISFSPLSNLLVVALHVFIILLIILPLQLLVIFWIFELHFI